MTDNANDAADADFPQRPAPPYNILYVPQFVTDYEDHVSKPPRIYKTDYAKENWLTPGLNSEIRACLPNRNDIVVEQGNLRDSSAFASAAARLFPIGRVFASRKQFDQVVEAFCSAWAVKKTHPGKYIGCHFGLPVVPKKDRHIDPSTSTKKRKVAVSPKSIVACPFRINYSYVDFPHNKQLQLPAIYYCIKITRANYQHTCSLNTNTHREAIQRSGNTQPDMNGVQDIISHLRERPTSSCSFLRPMLLKYLPFYKAADSKYIVNFRQRALKYIIEHAEDETPTAEEIGIIASRNTLAADEFTINDNPLSRQNLKGILRKVMQEDGGIWDAIRYLQDLVEKNPTMDFRVKYDDNGRPEAICWMLPEMRRDLTRFGDILFLDAQKRDMNRPGWPYIGPCVKDAENKVRVVSESICIAESMEIYHWILTEMAKMEPKFHLNKVRFIFADQLVTDQLLHQLGIQTTCILHGDPYHLLNKVWPESFGSDFDSLRPHLKQMLDGTMEQCEVGYQQATQLILHQPDKVSILDKIFDNPSYYSSWYLRQKEANFNFNGSVPSEQNHSSIVAHLGQGGNLSIAEHIRSLLERQVHLSKLRQTEEDKANQVRERFSSSHAGQHGANEVEAKKSLSNFGFKRYLTEANRNMQLTFDDLTETYNVWSCGYRPDNNTECPDYVQIKKGVRCPCSNRMCWDIQCRHELCIDGKFDLQKYNTRWFNDRTYAVNCQVSLFSEAHEHMLPGGHLGLQQQQDTEFVHNEGDISVNNNIDEGREGFNHYENEDDDDSVSISTNHEQYRLSYQSVHADCEILLRLISRDESLLQAFSTTVTTSIARARQQLSINTTFGMDTRVDQGADEHRNALPGRLGYQSRARDAHRLRSRHENRIANRARHAPLVRPSNDANFILNNNKRKSCGLCRQPGHKVGRCPKILCWNKLPTKDSNERSSLSLYIQNDNHFQKHTVVPDPDQPVVGQSLPPKMTGIVLHRVLSIHHTPHKQVTCLECTLLMEKGDPHPRYKEFPFSPTVIASYISRGSSSIIISLLTSAQQAGGVQPQPHVDPWQNLGPSTINYQGQPVNLSQQSIYSQQASTVTYPLIPGGALSQRSSYFF